MKTILCVVNITTILLSIQLLSVHIFGNRPSQAPTITAEQIWTLQADSKFDGRFLIVDVRDEAEIDVSIIPGAIALTEFEKTQKTHQEKVIIAYCTVGYRSGNYARSLRKNGWKAWNYQGSILDWCANRLPVVTTNGQYTRRVHTYNSSYALAAGYLPVY